MVNGVLIIGVGIYLIAVVFHDNSLALVQAMSTDLMDDDTGKAGFLKWLVALLFLFALALNSRLKPIVAPLIWMALIGLALTAAGNNSGALDKLSRLFTVPWRINIGSNPGGVDPSQTSP